VALLWESNLGLALQAAREEETAAKAVGIHVDRYHFLSLLLSACLTGISGAIYVHLTRYTVPGLVYSLHFSAVPMIFAMCGGRFTILGPALAALVLYPVDQFLFHPLLPAGHEFLYGLFLILVVLFMPGGFWGALRRSP
jgi:branched-chain amino acid transport system permease protein